MHVNHYPLLGQYSTHLTNHLKKGKSLCKFRKFRISRHFHSRRESGRKLNIPEQCLLGNIHLIYNTAEMQLQCVRSAVTYRRSVGSRVPYYAAAGVL